ncbi:unnamed protein product [Symbiodinium natans]|uniref:Uncharacterized protein n=1 Tax=Symbiodinium natans TaxID=878477 RepID=A0A812LYS6_9DINO|nr:unnamed protein product [Symbiodinium natans]
MPGFIDWSHGALRDAPRLETVFKGAEERWSQSPEQPLRSGPGTIRGAASYSQRCGEGWRLVVPDLRAAPVKDLRASGGSDTFDAASSARRSNFGGEASRRGACGSLSTEREVLESRIRGEERAQLEAIRLATEAEAHLARARAELDALTARLAAHPRAAGDASEVVKLRRQLQAATSECGARQRQIAARAFHELRMRIPRSTDLLGGLLRSGHSLLRASKMKVRKLKGRASNAGPARSARGRPRARSSSIKPHRALDELQDQCTELKCLINKTTEDNLRARTRLMALDKELNKRERLLQTMVKLNQAGVGLGLDLVEKLKEERNMLPLYRRKAQDLQQQIEERENDQKAMKRDPFFTRIIELQIEYVSWKQEASRLESLLSEPSPEANPAAKQEVDVHQQRLEKLKEALTAAQSKREQVAEELQDMQAWRLWAMDLFAQSVYLKSASMSAPACELRLAGPTRAFRAQTHLFTLPELPSKTAFFTVVPMAHPLGMEFPTRKDDMEEFMARTAAMLHTHERQIASQQEVIRELQVQVAELRGCEVKDFQHQVEPAINAPEAAIVAVPVMEDEGLKKAHTLASAEPPPASYDLDQSMWDAAVLLFCHQTAWTDKVILWTGMIVNNSLQVALLLTVFFDMLQNPYSSTKVQEMVAWRALKGHGHDEFDSDNGWSLINRLCQHKLWSFEQEEYKEMFEYLYMPMPGWTLSVLAIIMRLGALVVLRWVLTMMAEYRRCCEQGLALWNLKALKRGDPAVSTTEDGEQDEILGIFPGLRILAFVTLIVPRLFVTICLCIAA